MKEPEQTTAQMKKQRRNNEVEKEGKNLGIEAKEINRN